MYAKNKKRKLMAEEQALSQQPQALPTQDDLSMLSYILRHVRGSSLISATALDLDIVED